MSSRLCFGPLLVSRTVVQVSSANYVTPSRCELPPPLRVENHTNFRVPLLGWGEAAIEMSNAAVLRRYAEEQPNVSG